MPNASTCRRSTSTTTRRRPSTPRSWRRCGRTASRAGNAESRHAAGRAARRAWEQAKETVARILGADPSEVIFTSGGTESNNLAIFGLAGAGDQDEAGDGQRRGTSSPARSSTRRSPSRWRGSKPTGSPSIGPPSTPRGWPTPSGWPPRFRADTRFATLMLANNETGAIQPVARLAALAASRRRVPVHTDAVQAVGRIPVDFHALGVATLAASATSSTARWGSGCSWSGAASGSARGSSAAASSKGGGRGPSPCRWPSAWPPRWRSWHAEADGPHRPLDAAARPPRSRPDRRAWGPTGSSATARPTTRCASPRRSTSASPASTATPC